MDDKQRIMPSDSFKGQEKLFAAHPQYALSMNISGKKDFRV